MYLRYNELRLLMADQGALDAKELVSDRRDSREEAAERRPPSWVGTATQTALDFPYNALWGFPEKFHAGEPATSGEVRGLAASPGVVEGPARFVASLDEFDQVRDGEILVCRMTNPAWVVLFTKIIGLVTEAGGAVSHPAVVAREFGIPAVVGTTNAGERIKTGDRIRVNGSSGRGRDPRVSEPDGWPRPRWRRPCRCARSTVTATVLAGGTFVGILMNQGFLAPTALLSLGGVEELRGIDVVDGELRLGAMVRHRAVERSEVVREGWPVLAHAFSLVASPRVRNQATVGGVLADADYASDPPAMLAALDARAVLRWPHGDRDGDAWGS